METRSHDYTADSLLSVLVEITTYCNMDCPHCIRTIKDNKNLWGNKHIQVEEFQYIIDSLPHADEIVTQGIGEPTMHPHLPDLIGIASKSKKFKRITLTSNGMLRKENYYLNLFEAGLSKLYLSIDSLDQDRAEQLRPGTSVSRIKNLVSTLANRRPGDIAVRTTVSKDNIETIPELLSELNKLGSLDVYMHPYDDIGNSSGCLDENQSRKFSNEINELSKPFKNLRVVANSFVPSTDICVHPWKIPSITAEGYLVPCCRTMDKNVANFGNMFRDTFMELWHSSKTMQVRKDFLVKSASFCKGCPRYVFRE